MAPPMPCSGRWRNRAGRTKKAAAEAARAQARPRVSRHRARCRPRRLPPLRLRPVLDRQPLERDRRRALRRRLLAGIDPLPARQEARDGVLNSDRRRRARADDAACRAGRSSSGSTASSAIRRSRGSRSGKAWFRSPGRGRAPRRRRCARSRPSSAIRCAKSPIRSFAPVSNRLRAGVAANEAALGPAIDDPGGRQNWWRDEEMKSMLDGRLRPLWPSSSPAAAAAAATAAPTAARHAAPLKQIAAPNMATGPRRRRRRPRAASGWAIPTRR